MRIVHVIILKFEVKSGESKCRWQDHRNTRAKDVAIGDVLWALDEVSGNLRPHTVFKAPFSSLDQTLF